MLFAMLVVFNVLFSNKFFVYSNDLTLVNALMWFASSLIYANLIVRFFLATIDLLTKRVTAVIFQTNPSPRILFCIYNLFQNKGEIIHYGSTKTR